MLTETKQLPRGMMEIIPNKIEKELSENGKFSHCIFFCKFLSTLPNGFFSICFENINYYVIGVQMNLLINNILYIHTSYEVAVSIGSNILLEACVTVFTPSIKSNSKANSHDILNIHVGR